MNCDEALPLLPLAALAALEDALDREVAEHSRECERCGANLAELRRARAALDGLPVPHAPPTDLDVLFAATARRPALLRATPGTRPTWRAAAAAALLLAALGAGFLGARLAESAATAPSADARPLAAADGERLARAFLVLDDRLAALEQRHQRDLLELARAIDTTQAQRERAFSEQLTSLASLTGRELQQARHAVFVLSTQLPRPAADGADAQY